MARIVGSWVGDGGDDKRTSAPPRKRNPDDQGDVPKSSCFAHACGAISIRSKYELCWSSGNLLKNPPSAFRQQAGTRSEPQQQHASGASREVAYGAGPMVPPGTNLHGVRDWRISRLPPLMLAAQRTMRRTTGRISPAMWAIDGMHQSKRLS